MPLPLPTADEASLRRLIDAARSDACAVNDVGVLARHLAASGIQLQWPSMRTSDVASTGGPGSLSTLLPPLALAAAGRSVVKLAVPGRPAGAIDTLGTVPGYRTRLQAEDVRAIIASCGFAHFLADERFAPLDAQLFALRKRLNAVAVPVLAIASLLSKKLAVGVQEVGLDVRVGRHGNFGVTRDAARENARMFCLVARTVGIEAIAFLSTPDEVPQPWIGRGESLLALASAIGARPIEDSWLQEHVDDCLRMAGAISTPTRSLRHVLEQHLQSQGSSMHRFLERVDEVSNTERVPIYSDDAGILEIDLARVRDVLVKAQADSVATFRDSAGVHLLARPGRVVKKRDVLASVRGLHGESLNELAAAFSIVGGSPRDVVAMEIVHA